MTGNRFFLICVAWVIVAGSLTGDGQVHHVLPVFTAGIAMSLICPVGLIAVRCFRRSWW
jgi:hypothetical protein